jgi:hypothetical protein
LQDPNLHSGFVPVTGSRTIDLGIAHNNFVVSVSVKGGTAAIANNVSAVTWEYGTNPGTFTIFAWKATAAGTTTLIAATVAANVSFTVIADSSVG